MIIMLRLNNNKKMKNLINSSYNLFILQKKKTFIAYLILLIHKLFKDGSGHDHDHISFYMFFYYYYLRVL